MTWRPDKDQYLMMMALVAATRGTCVRRRVGCVLASARGHVLATGCNGAAPGEDHCLDNPCAAASAPSGTQLAGCRAIHAEQNALVQCRDPFAIHTVYCTTSPCESCVKLLMSTSAQRLVFLEEYPHPEARKLWCGSGVNFKNREWVDMSKPMDNFVVGPLALMLITASSGLLDFVELHLRER